MSQAHTEIVERQLAEQRLASNTPKRARTVDGLIRFAEGRQYEGRESFWNDNVPLFKRAPCIVYPAPMLAAGSFVSLVMGDGRFNGITTHCSEDDEAFDPRFGLSEDESEDADKVIQRAMKAGRVVPSLAAMLYSALVGKTSCAVVQVKRGVPRVELLPAQWVTPKFVGDDPEGDVESIEVLYPYLDEFETPDGEKHVECKLYRRTIDATADTTYVPLRAGVRKPEAGAWTVKASVPHGFGFCPVVWYRHRPKATDSTNIDGTAIHQELCDEVDGLNFALSIRHRAALMLGDPMIVEIGVDPDHKQAPGGVVFVPEKGLDSDGGGQWGVMRQVAGTGTIKSPGQTWRYHDHQSKVSILSLGPGALEPIEKNADDLLALIAEGMSWVPVDAKEMQLGSAPSGRALEWLHKKQLDACGVLRDDFAAGAILPVVGMILRAMMALPAGQVRVAGVDKIRTVIARFNAEVKGADDVVSTEWIAPNMSVKWGPYFAATEADQKLVSDQVRADLQGGLITRLTAVTRIQPFYRDIEDPATYVKSLEREIAEHQHAAAELMAAQGAKSTGEVDADDDDVAEIRAAAKGESAPPKAKKVVPMKRPAPTDKAAPPMRRRMKAVA